MFLNKKFLNFKLLIQDNEMFLMIPPKIISTVQIHAFIFKFQTTFEALCNRENTLKQKRKK